MSQHFRQLGANPALGTVLATAYTANSGLGFDSLDLLTAALANDAVRASLIAAAVDPDVVASSSAAGRKRLLGPGPADDAKLVLATLTRRALRAERDPGPVELLVALAVTPGPAQALLVAAGLAIGAPSAAPTDHGSSTPLQDRVREANEASPIFRRS